MLLNDVLFLLQLLPQEEDSVLHEVDVIDEMLELVLFALGTAETHPLRGIDAVCVDGAVHI